jgi:hypothetical protein
MGKMMRSAPKRIGKKMKQFGIDKKKISKTLRYALAIAVSASMMAGVCACNENSEASVPDSTTIETTAETTRVTNPTNETQETIVYIYGGRYYMAGDPQIEGKSGLTSMTLSDARDAGFNAGSEMTQDEKTAYDYNLAWNMVSEGKSDEEIVEALMSEGYCNNEVAANMVVEWVREDWDMGIRAYEEPQNTPSVPSSNEGNSGSGNSGSGSSTEPTGSTYVPSDVTPLPTQSTQPTTAPTSAPTEPTSAPTQPTSAPTQPTSAPTEPTSAPTEPTSAPTSAPTETTPAPTETEAKYITHYVLNGIAYDDADNSYSFSCTGSSYQNCLDQFDTYCANHGYYPSNYNCAAVWSDGSMTYA